VFQLGFNQLYHINMKLALLINQIWFHLIAVLSDIEVFDKNEGGRVVTRHKRMERATPSAFGTRGEPHVRCVVRAVSHTSIRLF
jgi:hypothetical protein